MKSIIFPIVVLFLFFKSNGQEKSTSFFSAFTITDSLKKDASAIVRLDEGILDVISPSNYTLDVHRIITIMNAEGEEYLQHMYRFDKFLKIESLEIRLYNAFGLPVKKYGKKDFAMHSPYDGVSFVTDDKLLYLKIPAPQYPCTVEIMYKATATGYVELPNWHINTNNSSTEVFRYIVRAPLEMDIRHRTVNFLITPQTELAGKKKIYTWEAKNIAAKKIDQGGFELTKYLPQVQVAPTSFEFDGYKGDFKTWADFGKWNYPFYTEKNSFNEQRIKEIKALAGQGASIKEKVSLLYDYLQRNMRYVSIQLGIGGFKPFPASFVDEKKYGDCKALTNYMRNMLSVIGIRSHPALINSGYNKLPADPYFPADPFNHVILCIPNDRDTIWLECTSNDAKAGFLGSFTENKHALLITENGGVLVKTPDSKPESSTLLINNEIFLNEEGGGKVFSKLYATGDFMSLIKEQKNSTVDEQKELFVKFLHYRDADVFNNKGIKDSAMGYVSSLDLEYEKLYDFKAGDKFFFPAHLNKTVEANLPVTEKREIEYIFPFPYERITTTTFHLPKGFSVEKLGASRELDHEVLSYKRKVSHDSVSNTVTLIMCVTLKKHIVLPAVYASLAQMFANISKEETEKITFSKTGN